MKKVGFITKNVGKYRNIVNLFNEERYEYNIIWLNNLKDVEEGNNVCENAKLKAVSGSIESIYPVLASDEAMDFDFLPANEQPGAYIKRLVGENPTDEELIVFYSKLISSKNRDKAYGKIITSYAIAYKGELINEFILEQDNIFKANYSSTRIEGRPLASLHYIPEYECYYSDLDEQQKQELSKHINDSLKSYIINTLGKIYSLE